MVMVAIQDGQQYISVEDWPKLCGVQFLFDPQDGWQYAQVEDLSKLVVSVFIVSFYF